MPGAGKGFVVIAAGSDSDMPHLENLAKEIGKFGIPSQIRICSAHKQPAKLQALIEELNKSPEPVMMVGCAGGTDALSGTASYLAKFPVVSCPPEKDNINRTCLTNPPGSSNAFIAKPNNIGKFAAQFFASRNAEVSKALDGAIAEKITKLEQADDKLTGGKGAAVPSATAPAGVALAKTGSVVIAAGSDSDMPHLENLKSELAKFNIPSQIRICSAHKQPARLQALIQSLNESGEPVLMVGCAGGTDALSGTASYLAKFPVVSCPPEKDNINMTCLTNPPGSSNAFIAKPNNIAKFAAQYFASMNPEVSKALDAAIVEKVRKLEQADEQLLKKATATTSSSSSSRPFSIGTGQGSETWTGGLKKIASDTLLKLRGMTLEQAVAAEAEARRALEEKKAAYAEAVESGPAKVAAAEAALVQAAADLKVKEAEWQQARDLARAALQKELGPPPSAGHGHDDHGHGHGHGDHDDVLHGAKHQLEHRWIEKTGFGIAERVVAHAADSLTERVSEYGTEYLIERTAEHLATQAVEKASEGAASHMVTRILGETLRMGEITAINALKALRVLVPLVGMFFVGHLAKHDWHRFKDDKGLAKFFFLLAVIGDWIDIGVHIVVVWAGLVEGLGISHVDHHWLHEVEAYGMKAAIFACLTVMCGEIISARAQRALAAKKAPEPKVVAVAGP